MTSTVGVNQVPPSTSQEVSGKKDALGKDQFLSLLVTQLQHQDPLNPMDSTGFTAQLAQFSSLEQLQNVNETLGVIRNLQNAGTSYQAVNYIGKTVTATGNEIALTEGSADDIQFTLAAGAKEVFVNIYDAMGNFVKNIEHGKMESGDRVISWDGTDQQGNAVPDGSYRFEVMAVDENDALIEARTYTTGRVTGVTFKNGSAYLVAGSLEIPVSRVIEVKNDTETI